MIDFEKEIQKVQKEIIAKKQELKDLERYLKSLEIAARNKKKILIGVEQTNQKIPKEISVSPVLDEVQE